MLQNIFESVNAFRSENARQYPSYRKNPNGNCFAGSRTKRRKEQPKEKSEIEQYQEQLQAAIDEQNFELAAELRDKIKALSEKAE